ncbi:hypothetical protein Pjdr2_2644 [Paenibacillus sp. JDR-2]|nr:hypothetical protein Pjdr2_2644 [Paenibacillus sp. JDR-2]
MLFGSGQSPVLLQHGFFVRCGAYDGIGAADTGTERFCVLFLFFL